jgi:hypothetical protein
MIEIFQATGGDRDNTIAEYAAAERRGEVPRKSNKNGISPEEYAMRLFADGVGDHNGGWLR